MSHEVDCQHAGTRIGTRWIDPETPVGVYGCVHPQHREAVLGVCDACPDRLSMNGSRPATLSAPSTAVDNGCRGCGGRKRRRSRGRQQAVLPAEPKRSSGVPAVVDRWEKPAGMEDMHLGGHVFLTCSGPSLNDIDWGRLQEPGVITMGVNNVAAHRRTNLWTMGDSVRKFHDSIWWDPAITKFVPYPKLKNHIRTKQADGTFMYLGETCREMPGVMGIRRNSAFDPDAWLWEDYVNWGNGKKAAEGNGYPRVLSTFIQAVRLCFYLGFRHVYLLGCDFTMGDKYVYAFDQDKHAGAVGSNNGSYVKIGKMFEMLQPRFLEAKFHVFNCNPNSALKVFPTLSLDESLAEAKKNIPAQVDLSNWYTTQ